MVWQKSDSWKDSLLVKIIFALVNNSPDPKENVHDTFCIYNSIDSNICIDGWSIYIVPFRSEFNHPKYLFILHIIDTDKNWKLRVIYQSYMKKSKLPKIKLVAPKTAEFEYALYWITWSIGTDSWCLYLIQLNLQSFQWYRCKIIK